jgi:hypothetical protein
LTSIPENATVRIRATPSAEGLSIAIVQVEPQFSLGRADPGMSHCHGKAEIYHRLMDRAARSAARARRR